ncbi:threonine-phosphate decarboxylase CobD [Cohaesibacter celericrescens]|uniref:threonine-phosphate decarboxylase n=1 Tax=Cohaesibacter celericrescens TaxID=2067669 RepID=A0A2N5XT37_9HYPH|nr:threonine-phosphate decarboxylase CobD [Cohaesibacter celericrescens]PLW77672.1 threonine-phosphate decarboxylase [Cohaesibacter celericrescens]
MVASDDKIMMHGGDLSAAIARFGGSSEDWLDLSSGINHSPYPFDKDAAFEAIASLPSQGDLVACLAAARKAYGVPDEVSIVASPGTQSIIQAMPVLLGTNQSCLILGPTYSEHQRAMARAGVDVAMVQELPKEFFPGDCLLIVNPNNPDGRQLPAKDLIELAAKLQKQRGLLIVDEAFADVVPELSVVSELGSMPNCVVLRSFGKFFGMSGIRLGFLVGHESHVSKIRDMLGPWAVSTPALRVGTESLNDSKWQQQQRKQMAERAEKLDRVLEKRNLYIAGGTPLFRLVIKEDARELHRKLAELHIWTRVFDYRTDFIRFGIPIDKKSLDRLDASLEKVLQR